MAVSPMSPSSMAGARGRDPEASGFDVAMGTSEATIIGATAGGALRRGLGVGSMETNFCGIAGFADGVGGVKASMTLEGTFVECDWRGYSTPWAWLRSQLKEISMAKKMPMKKGGGKKPCK